MNHVLFGGGSQLHSLALITCWHQFLLLLPCWCLGWKLRSSSTGLPAPSHHLTRTLIKTNRLTKPSSQRFLSVNLYHGYKSFPRPSLWNGFFQPPPSSPTFPLKIAGHLLVILSHGNEGQACSVPRNCHIRLDARQLATQRDCSCTCCCLLSSAPSPQLPQKFLASFATSSSH